MLRNLLGSAAVAATVAAIGLGLPAVNRALPSARPIASDRPYMISAGVSVVPPPDTTVDVTKTVNRTSTGTVLFVIDSVRYAIVAEPFDGTLAAATSRLRTKILANRGYQVTGGQVPTSTGAGVTGRQGMYSSADRDGRYAVFLSHGIDVEVTIAGNDVDLTRTLPAIEASVASIAFVGAR